MEMILEQFVVSLEESGLMTADEVRAFIDSLPSDQKPTSGAELAQFLVRAKRLTEYQAQTVYQGKTKGLTLGDYVVLDQIGHGGMGQVYKARHRWMEREAAVKILRSAVAKSPEHIRRFHREVKVAAQLSHPNIVAAYDAGQADGIFFLAMEYVRGTDLASLVKKQGPLPLATAIDYVIQAARGLEYAHGKGIIHRDVKPSNLLVDNEGTVKVLDMGLARLKASAGHDQPASEDALTTTGQAMGTADYIAPEQAENSRSVDQRADIYSLGCTLFFLLTGRRVYSGDSTVATVLAHREAPIPALGNARDDMPESVNRVFRKMVAKTSEARYQSMSQVIGDLLQCVDMDVDQIAETQGFTAIGLTKTGEPPESGLDAGQIHVDNASVLHPPVPSPVDDPVPSHAKSGRGRIITWSALAGLAFLIAAVWGVMLMLRTPTTEETLGDGQPADPTAASSDSDRQVAEWVLARGGKLSVSVRERSQDVNTLIALPNEDFRVTHIDLNENQHVTSADLEQFGSLEKLSALMLSHTSVDDAGLAHLKQLTALRDLCLDGTAVTDSGLSHLRDLTSLGGLALDETQITSAGIRHLEGLHDLFWITLSSTKIHDDGLQYLRSMRRLESLDLDYTNVTDSALEHLTGLTTLTELRLVGTKVTPNGVAKLQVALPNCKTVLAEGND